MATEFEENREKRRSFYCSNKLWNTMKEVTNNIALQLASLLSRL